MGGNMSFLGNIFGVSGDKKEDIPSPKIETKPTPSQSEQVLVKPEMTGNLEKKGMPQLAKRIETVMAEIEKRRDPELEDLTEMDKNYVVNYWVGLVDKIDQMIMDKKIAFKDGDLIMMTKDIKKLDEEGLLPDYPSEIAKNNPAKVGDLINYCLTILGFDKDNMDPDQMKELLELIKKNQPKSLEQSSEKVPVGVV